MEEVCPTCGLPKSLCVCQDIAKESQKIRVRVVKKAFGKVTTLVSGFEQPEQAKEFGKLLKRKFACGGTVKHNEIELQGMHRDRVKAFLLEQGFKKELIDD